MDTYYSARYADLQRMEAETMLYPAEVAEWKARNPNRPLVFKTYLIQSAGTPR